MSDSASKARDEDALAAFDAQVSPPDRFPQAKLMPEGALKKTQVIADGGGLRKNTGKNRLDLLPVEWTWALGDVMTQGSLKYAARNWERGMAWSIMVGCALRHTLKFVCGERYDDETGCHHLAMAAWNCLGLMSYDLREIGENDLAQNKDLSILARVHCRKD